MKDFILLSLITSSKNLTFLFISATKFKENMNYKCVMMIPNEISKLIMNIINEIHQIFLLSKNKNMYEKNI